MLDVNDLTKPRSGFFYEPRVLWGMGFVTRVMPNEGAAQSVLVVPPSRDSYYNGERWPIILTSATTLVQSPAGFPYVGDSLFSQLPLEIGGIGTARYSVGRVTGLLEPQPSAEALESIAAGFDLNPLPAHNLVRTPADTAYPLTRTRGVYNTVRWDFDHALKLPPSAFLEMQLAGRIPTPIDTSNVPVTADVNFFASAPQEAAQWPANAMVRTRMPIGQLAIPTAQTYYSASTFNASNEGADVDATTLPFQSFAGGPLTQLYPPTQVFTPRQSAQQRATYSAPTSLSGMAVSFEQAALDNALIAGMGTTTGPLSTTTYARCRSRNGGTQNFWWRDGAPLAICFPTMTPAVTHRLRRPLAVQPGEGFKVTLPQSFDPLDRPLFPYAGQVPNSQDPRANISQLVFYLAFTGYALVEA